MAEKINIESPVAFESLQDVKRVFIFGLPSKSLMLSYMLMGRPSSNFFGYFTALELDSLKNEVSSFKVKSYADVADKLQDGDFVFLYERNTKIEQELCSKGVRIGTGGLLVQIYTTYELPVFANFCKQYLTENDISIDVGANHGITTAILSKYSSFVHAFEINSDLQNNYNHHLEYITNYKMHKKAVYLNSGVVKYADANNGNMSMRTKNKAEELKIEAVSLDDFCSRLNITPGFIKVDVEGVDAEVILGGANIIDQHKPKIFCEHPLHGIASYLVDEEMAEEAMKFLGERYELLAFPHRNQLCSAQDIGSPLVPFVKNYGYYPVNFAAV